MTAVRSLLVLAAVLAVFNLHGLFPDPALAFYVMRGWLGCVGAAMLWRGWTISGPVAACWAWYEATASVCGVLYVAAPAAFGGQCDAGTGTPVNLLGLVGAALAAVATIRGSLTGEGKENG